MRRQSTISAGFDVRGKGPLECHRTILVCRHLRDEFEIRHILENGDSENQAEAETRLLAEERVPSEDFFVSRQSLIDRAYDLRAGKIAYHECAETTEGHSKFMPEKSIEVFTIGFTKKAARDFFEKIRDAGVKRVVDVRLNNVSQLAGFSKRDDLKYFLKTILGIEYVEEPLFAPTQPMLDAHRKNKGPWVDYEKGLSPLDGRTPYRREGGSVAHGLRLPALQRR